jgi:hypothetical protein
LEIPDRAGSTEPALQPAKANATKPQINVITISPMQTAASSVAASLWLAISHLLYLLCTGLTPSHLIHKPLYYRIPDKEYGQYSTNFRMLIKE